MSSSTHAEDGPSKVHAVVQTSMRGTHSQKLRMNVQPVDQLFLDILMLTPKVSHGRKDKQGGFLYITSQLSKLLIGEKNGKYT